MCEGCADEVCEGGVMVGCLRVCCRRRDGWKRPLSVCMVLMMEKVICGEFEVCVRVCQGV